MFRGMRFTGAVFLLAGTFLYGIVRLAVALYMPQMKTWQTPKDWSARVEIGGSAPYYLSIIFILVGVIMLVVPLCYDWKALKKTN